MMLPKLQKVFLGVCLCVLLLAAPTLSFSILRTVEGTVTNVSDGDSLKLATVEGTALKVRLYGIDAPELEQVNRKTGMVAKPGQPYGTEACQALRSRVLGHKVRLDIMDIDRYKRPVGIVSMNNRNINLEIIKEGYAWAYREYLRGPYASEFIDAEGEARERRLGLWNQSNPQPPWEFRKLSKNPANSTRSWWNNLL